MSVGSSNSDLQAARERVNSHPVWYHTIDLLPGLTTPGWYDLRHAVDLMPWPDVRGKRCLDVGTFDGFFAFELERRGAAEVVAVDLTDQSALDWPLDCPAEVRDPELRTFGHLDEGGFRRARGFQLAAEIIGSKVKWKECSIYDLDPSALGTFDVVVCGSLLLHLRDPLRALAAVRSVTSGSFLSSEQIELWLSIFGRGRPLFRLDGRGIACQWWLANSAGHQRLLSAAGFDVVARSKPYVVEYNVHPVEPTSLRTVARGLAMRAVTGSSKPGVLHRGVRCQPSP